MYSPAARPSRQRAAPAKKRRLSTITGISSSLDRFDRLARVERLQARDLIAVLLEHGGDRQQGFRALGGRRLRPAVEGPARGHHGAVHVLGSFGACL